MFRRKWGSRNFQSMPRNTRFGKQSAHVTNGVHRSWQPGLWTGRFTSRSVYRSACFLCWSNMRALRSSYRTMDMEPPPSLYTRTKAHWNILGYYKADTTEASKTWKKLVSLRGSCSQMLYRTNPNERLKFGLWSVKPHHLRTISGPDNEKPAPEAPAPAIWKICAFINGYILCLFATKDFLLTLKKNNFNWFSSR